MKTTSLLHAHEEGFAIFDAKGREIGGKFYVVDRDGKIVLTVHATRDRESFGRCNRGAEVATLEEGIALGKKKLAASKRAFARRAARGEDRQFAKKEGAA